jgi:hypothetical protein
VVQDGEKAGIDPHEARADATGVQVHLLGRPFGVPAEDPGRRVGRCHSHNSWCKAAALMTAAARSVVTPDNVSIDADGLVDVSVEPVVISIHALPRAG